MYEEEMKFIEEYESKVVDLTAKANLAFFNASISGKKEDYKLASDLQIELNKIYSDTVTFEQLKKLKEKRIDDRIIKRQIDTIYNEYAGNQSDFELQKEIIELSTAIEEKFSTFRVSVNGEELTDNQVDEILKTSGSGTELKYVWEASKEIGNVVSDDIIKLVRLRNKAAAQVGFENYHKMSLTLSEQDSDYIDKLFDELDELTREEFAILKIEIDKFLSEGYNIEAVDLRPWHYRDKFFQQGPKIYKVDYNKFYKKSDPVEVTRKYYNDLGLQVDSILDNSDLYEKENKYQHAYCTDINRSGDIRVVCNVKPNHQWMGTMLHELGHAVYDKYVSSKLPWQLRTQSHILTTEAIAMLFGRFASNPFWINDMLNIGDSEVTSIMRESMKSLRLEQLTFCRWTQVIYRFEKALYENPDADLNGLWWTLVEKYQQIKKPEGRINPDWAAKIHIALYPAYYHNYMLGELLASQLYNYISNKVITGNESGKLSFVNRPEVGEYLKSLFFSYGALYPWNELIVKATGETLSAKYYAEQFVSTKSKIN